MNERIAIIGSGLIGLGWAIVFARAGCQVQLHDSSPDALTSCMAQLPQSLEDLRQHDLLDEIVTHVMARIKPCATLEEALQDTALAQENVRETLEAKQEIFARMDRIAAPHTVLASSTSWIKASDFAADLPGRQRILVAHPVNPPHLVPLVELAPAPWTHAQSLETARRLFAQAGQTPVLLRKEITGFLLNRIQGVVINEALNLYADGYASAEDLDLVLKDGLGLRWSFMGPFETIDLNAPQGLLDYASRYGSSLQNLAREQTPNDWHPSMLQTLQDERRAALPAEQIPTRARWRDQRLMALLAHRRTQKS